MGKKYSMSLDIYGYLKWSALFLTLNSDQIPDEKYNCRKADICVYPKERNEGLAVGNDFHIYPKGIKNSLEL